MARKTAHEKIMELREYYGIPEEKTTSVEDSVYRKQNQLRGKRLEASGTNENYAKMFNRDPWTDEWLGKGEDPDMKYFSKEEQDFIRKEKEKEWKRKYAPKLPVYHLPAEKKDSKKVKKLRKKRKKAENREEYQKKIDLAYWWLEGVLTKSFRSELYYKYRDDLDGLIELCSQWALDWAEDMTYDDQQRNLSVDDMYERMQARQEENAELINEPSGLHFKRREVVERHRREYVADPYVCGFPDIPDEYWKEFSKWCKTHPIKKYEKKAKSYGYLNISAAGLRRIKFLKKINKRNKSWRKNLMLHDPITGASFISEKKMKKNIEEQLKRYDKRRKQLVNMLDRMVADGQISEDMANTMMGDTKLVRDRVRKRLDDEVKRMRIRKKEEEKIYQHKKKTYEARKKWFKENGGNINDPPFSVVIDGEIFSVDVIPPKGKNSKPIYKVRTGDGVTNYSESSLYDAMNIRKPPEPPSPIKDPKYSKEYWDSYKELPDF